MTIGLQIDWVVLAMLIYIRSLAFLMAMPVFSGRQMPVRLRMAFAGMLVLILFPMVEAGDMPTNLPQLGLACLHAAFIGFLLGFALKILFGVLEFAGHVISVEMGLMMSSNFDPIRETHSTTIGNLLYYTGLLLFFLTGLYQESILAFVRSFQLQPAGATMLEVQSIKSLVDASSSIFLIGLQMSAPLVAINFLINLSFAILGKVVPKMNVFITSLAVRLAAGFLLLFATIGLITNFIVAIEEDATELMLRSIINM